MADVVSYWLTHWLMTRWSASIDTGGQSQPHL